MDSIVLSYLKQNKDKYDINALKKEILSKGYSEFDFDEAMNELKRQDFSTPMPVVHKKLGEVTKPNKKKKLPLILFSVIILLALGFVILNYLGFNIAGINIFG